MKVLIFLALVTLAVASPWGLQTEDDVTGQLGAVGSGYGTGGLRALLSGKYGGIRGLNKIGGPFSRYGGIGGVSQQQWNGVPQYGGVPNYGPYVKVGNTVVPRHLLEQVFNQRRIHFGGDNLNNPLQQISDLNTPFQQYGDIESQIYGQGAGNTPFTPYGGSLNTPFSPYAGGLNTPFSPYAGGLNTPLQQYEGVGNQIYGQEAVNIPYSRYGGRLNSPFQAFEGTGSQIYGRGIPFQYGGLDTQYGNQLANPNYEFDNINGDEIDQNVLQRVNPLSPTRGLGFTPY